MIKLNITLLTIILASTCAPLFAADKPSRLDRAPAAQETPARRPLDDFCPSSCPTWDTDIPEITVLHMLPGFDQPLPYKESLGACRQDLAGCSQKELDAHLTEALDYLSWRQLYPRARCIVASLICQAVNPNTSNRNKETALHLAAKNDDYHFADFLLRHLANVNATTIGDSSPLHYNLFRAGDTRITQLLVERNADVNAKDFQGATPLVEIATHCRKYMDPIPQTKILLDAGAEPHHRKTSGIYSGKTALEIARAQEKHTRCRTFADFLEDYEKQPNRIQE